VVHNFSVLFVHAEFVNHVVCLVKQGLLPVTFREAEAVASSLLGASGAATRVADPLCLLDALHPGNNFVTHTETSLHDCCELRAGAEVHSTFMAIVRACCSVNDETASWVRAAVQRWACRPLANLIKLDMPNYDTVDTAQ
jgi:hypothetical protein